MSFNGYFITFIIVMIIAWIIDRLGGGGNNGFTIQDWRNIAQKI